MRARDSGTIESHGSDGARAGVIVQAGVIPWRLDSRRRVSVLLITNSQGDWIVAKGSIDAGHTARQAAEVEAWEEAGVRGTAGKGVGSYVYRKLGRVYRVRLFGMHVESLAVRWPEMHRSRRWVEAEHAAGMVAFRGLAGAIRRLTKEIESRAAAAGVRGVGGVRGVRGVDAGSGSRSRRSAREKARTGSRVRG